MLIKKVNSEVLIVQIYIDDIIFSATNEILSKEFFNYIPKEFEISMIGELNFFFGNQVKQMKHGTFLSQIKSCTKLIMKFSIKSAKEASTPMATSTYLDLDEKSCKLDRKSISGTCHL